MVNIFKFHKTKMTSNNQNNVMEVVLMSCKLRTHSLHHQAVLESFLSKSLLKSACSVSLPVWSLFLSKVAQQLFLVFDMVFQGHTIFSLSDESLTSATLLTLRSEQVPFCYQRRISKCGAFQKSSYSLTVTKLKCILSQYTYK